MRGKELTLSEKHHLIQFLIQGTSNGKLIRGRHKAAMVKFNKSKSTISRFWAAAKKMQEEGQVISMKNTKSKERRKRVHVDLDLIASLELQKRSTIRSLACAIDQSKTTVGRWAQYGQIRAHTSAIRPELTAPNKLSRLIFSLQALELDNTLTTLRFKSMHNTVHIDEKWFYMTKGMHRFYLTPNEHVPHRTCKSKKFITKVMFMCAVSRPIFCPDGGVIFYGKIGMFPLTYQEPAIRSSKNRPAGTMVTKAIESVTKDVVRDCIVNKIIPAIKAKWPSNVCKHVFIQQDNAKPHIKDNDPVFREASIDGGFTFTLVQQPPNSPDTNVNDLGWFHAIQAIQHQQVCHTIDDLVHAVENSYAELTATKLNNVFLSLQGCMKEIMTVMGHNRYIVPHIGKEAMLRAGTLPLNLNVDVELVRDCLYFLMEAGAGDQVQIISNDLGIHIAAEAEEEEEEEGEEE